MSDDASTPEAPENTAADAGHNPWSAPGSVPEGAEGPQYASAEGAEGPQSASAETAAESRDASAEGAGEPQYVGPQWAGELRDASAEGAGEPHVNPQWAGEPRDASPEGAAESRDASAEGTEAPQYASPGRTGEPQYAGPERAGEPRDAEPRVALSEDAEPRVALSKDAAAAGQGGTRDQAPSLSVHDQRTVTSLPSVTPAAPAVGDGVPQGWASPAAPPANGSLASFPPPNPATAAGGPHPFAPPVVQDGAVPPPPIAPDGPGRMPYPHPGGRGYAAPVGYGGAPGPYGWPGMRPMENGMGITAMVLGIIAAGGFCMWPAAIVTGVLAVMFGLIGRAKARRGEASNPGQALAGIICGAAGFVLGIGLAVLVIVAG
ncbi:hypothetical protein [Streptomyces sp. NPDC014995]|uniref:DUF4190 domain-containing protein n=1 Tax=Streptomyces sp. NPDC014995 TaxID=3364936 RepID=UPI0036F9CE9C